MGKSIGWPSGSTRAYRKARDIVLERDGWICQLCGKPIPRHLRGPHPQSGSAHHTGAREVTGDNPAHMVASHLLCNQQAGNPRTAPDPAPRGRTRW